MSVNKVILIGYLGKDPGVRYDGGKPIVTISLATTTPPEDLGNGIMLPERTEWHNIVAWGRNAEIVERYVKKGTQLYIEGKLRTRMWEDRNQIKRYVTEVYVDVLELLGRRGEGNA